jgi:pyridoxine 4-dehydrogenase
MTNPHTPTALDSGTFTLGGHGGLTVRRLGFGAMRLTGAGNWGPPRDRDEALAVLRRAVDLGVNVIDTADVWGPGVSEELIAQALYPYPQDLVIATKGGLVGLGPGQRAPDGRPEHLRTALEASLQRLRLERIDLYQLHRPDPNVPFEESVGALAELQRAGKIRYIGLSNVTSEQLARARPIVPIAAVENRYNLTDRGSESEEVLEVCARDGMAFLPYVPLATGELTRGAGLLDQIARRHDATGAQIALAWLLQRSPVLLPIPGTSSVRHLDENVAAAGIRLSQDEFERLSDNGRP